MLSRQYFQNNMPFNETSTEKLKVKMDQKLHRKQAAPLMTDNPGERDSLGSLKRPHLPRKAQVLTNGDIPQRTWHPSRNWASVTVTAKLAPKTCSVQVTCQPWSAGLHLGAKRPYPEHEPFSGQNSV